MEAVEEKWSHEGFWEGKKDFEVEAAEDLDMGWYASQFQSIDAQQLYLATGYWTIQYWSPTWPLHSRPSAYHHCLQPPGVDPWISDSFLLKRCHAAWKWLMAQAAHSFCSNESHWKTASISGQNSDSSQKSLQSQLSVCLSIHVGPTELGNVDAANLSHHWAVLSNICCGSTLWPWWAMCAVDTRRLWEPCFFWKEEDTATYEIYLHIVSINMH